MVTRYDSIPVTGVIHSVQVRDAESGDTTSATDFPREGIAPASRVSYTIMANDPRAGRVMLPGVVPQHERWDESINIRPAKPGTSVTGIMSVFGGATIIHWTIIEMPGVKSCREVTGG